MRKASKVMATLHLPLGPSWDAAFAIGSWLWRHAQRFVVPLNCQRQLLVDDLGSIASERSASGMPQFNTIRRQNDIAWI